jgi:hypothetical protein
MVENENRTNTVLALLAMAIMTIAWSALLSLGAIKIIQWML